MYYVYVLQSEKDWKFYTGLTHDVRKRLEEHNCGISAATKNRIPFRLVYFEFCWEYKDALKRERYLKTTWGKRYIKTRISHYLKGIT
jgi:putative endonuclease